MTLFLMFLGWNNISLCIVTEKIHTFNELQRETLVKLSIYYQESADDICMQIDKLLSNLGGQDFESLKCIL